jgi:hypothetical protein
MANYSFTVRAEWDHEAELWYVADSDIPGLAAEAPTTEALLVKLRILIPELVELNRHLISVNIDPYLPIHLMSERIEQMIWH